LTPRRQYHLCSRRGVSTVPTVPLPADIDADLGRALRSLREQRGRSQEALAHDAGVTLRTLQRIERSQANPTWSTVRRIARALGVTLTELARTVDDAAPGDR
jgi:transcriptional regulator with XRE-family HTH domain